MDIISVRKNPEYAPISIKYFQDKWANQKSSKVYEDCINHSIDEETIPQWYLLYSDNTIVGCGRTNYKRFYQ